MPNDKLSVKQKLFVDYYVQTKGNASEAARLAGYSSKTYYAMGQENLKKPSRISDMYKAYHALGGNGAVTGIYNEFLTLPHSPKGGDSR